MHRRAFLALLLVTSLLAASGCMIGGPTDLRREVASAADLDLDREIGLDLGFLSLGIARLALGDEPEARAALHGVRKVEVGVYTVERFGSTRSELDRLSLPNYIRMIRTRDEDSTVQVYGRFDDKQRLRRLVVVELDQDELVIVRMKGRLDQMLERVLDLEEARSGRGYAKELSGAHS